MIEYDWLMVDGISFTCEICFDHDRRSAKNTYLADIVTGRTTRIPSSSDKGLTFVPIPAYQAQISLVSSAGMTVTEDALALTNMGVIFLQDGLNNSSNRMYWGAMEGCEYTKGFQFDGGTEAVRREAILSKDDVFFEYRSVQSFQRYPVYYEWEKRLKGSFSSNVYPPELVIYASMDVAQVL
jgi:hypothetical protein